MRGLNRWWRRSAMGRWLPVAVFALLLAHPLTHARAATGACGHADSRSTPTVGAPDHLQTDLCVLCQLSSHGWRPAAAPRPATPAGPALAVAATEPAPRGTADRPAQPRGPPLADC